MRYDLIACFFREADDKEPVYSCPLGIFSETNAYDSWDLKEWGFKEDPDSTPGYLDYINRDFHKDDLQFITKSGYVSEVMDVLHCGENFGRIDVFAKEIDTIDDEGTLPPMGFFITDTFVEFGQTEPLSPVWFIDGSPYEADENTRRFRVPLKKLKDYFEAGVDDAVDLAARTFFGLRDLDGNPQILHALAVGMAGETKDERIVGFLHDVVEDSPVTLEDLRVYGYSDEVVEAVGLLTHGKDISYDDYIAKIGFSGNDLAIKVKLRDLRHNIERGKVGGHETLVRKHEEAHDALMDYKEGRAHVIIGK